LPFYRFNPQPWFGWLGAIGLDEDHVPTVDLECPIIMVRLREAGPFTPCHDIAGHSPTS
jgi:hypothetical protein